MERIFCRYDVVLIANQKKGNYWMHAVGLGDCAIKNTSQTAIIRYQGAMEMSPQTGSKYMDGDRNGMVSDVIQWTFKLNHGSDLQ